MKKVIKIKDIDPIYFAGASDKNIKLIESNFESKIVLRGNELVVDGSKKDIKLLQNLVNEIVNTITRKDSISTSDIQILIQSQINDKIDQDIDKEDILLEDLL